MTEVLIAILAAWGFGFACGMFFTTRDLSRRLDQIDSLQDRSRQRLREMQAENDAAAYMLSLVDEETARQVRKVMRDLRRSHAPERYDSDL